MNMYQEELLDHYFHPRNHGALENPSFLSTEFNPLCGDEITITAHIKDGICTAIQFKGTGCAISQASASLLTESTKGQPIEKLKSLSTDDMLTFLKIPINPARENCALLALQALQKGLAKYAHSSINN